MKISDVIINENEMNNDILLFLKNNKKNLNLDVLKFCFENNIFLYRGYEEPKEKYFCAFPRKTRKPRDTLLIIQKIIDSIYKENDIGAMRGNSFFTTVDKSFAEEYGDVYVVFPYKNFYYSYNKNPKIKDLYWDFIINEKMFISFIVKKVIPNYVKNFFYKKEEIYKIFYNLDILNNLNLRSNFYKLIYILVEEILNIIEGDDSDKKIKFPNNKIRDAIVILFDLDNNFKKFEVFDKKFMIESVIKLIYFSFFPNKFNLDKNLDELIKKTGNKSLTSGKIEEIKNKILNIMEIEFNYFRNENMISILKNKMYYIKEYEKGSVYGSDINPEIYDFYKNIFANEKSINYIKKVILNNIVFGKAPNDTQLFLNIMKQKRSNEILINGGCCFVHSDLLNDKFDQIEEILLKK